MQIQDELRAPKNPGAGIDFFHGWYAVLLTAMISIVALVVIWAMHIIGEVPLADLTRDAVAVTNGLPWHGLLSQIGVFFWAGAGTVCVLLWTSATSLGFDRRLANFGLFSALLTILLALDDTLMLHERVLPIWFGVPEKATFATYIALALAHFYYFRGVIIRTDMKLLILSLAMFAASLVVDFNHKPSDGGNLIYLAEDGTKFAGIVAWFGYFFVNTRAVVLLKRQA